jgi:hypothetical protein
MTRRMLGRRKNEFELNHSKKFGFARSRNENLAPKPQPEAKQKAAANRRSSFPPNHPNRPARRIKLVSSAAVTLDFGAS